MSYNKKAVRACMPTQLEQERGAGGGALLFPLSRFLPSHPPCIKLEREKGKGRHFFYSFTLPSLFLTACALPFFDLPFVICIWSVWLA